MTEEPSITGSKKEREDLESGEQGTPAAIKVFLLLFMLVALAGLLWMLLDLTSAHEVVRATEAPLPATQRLRHEPSSGTTYYIWTDRDHRLQSTRAFERVPGWALTALEVWRPDFGERPTSRGGYIVDLSEARPGEMLTATLRDRAWISAASQAADAGEAHGILTAYFAGELANLHPESERHQAIEQLEHNLQQIEARRPLSSQEIIELIRAAQSPSEQGKKP